MSYLEAEDTQKKRSFIVIGTDKVFSGIGFQGRLETKPGSCGSPSDESKPRDDGPLNTGKWFEF